MQTEQMVFQGTDAEQQVARDVWLAMRMLGASFAANAPIRQPLTTLAGFFARQRSFADVKDPAAVIDAALSKNGAVFAREESADGVVTFATTRAGLAPEIEVVDLQHMLKARLTEPEPVAIVAPPPVAAEPAVRVADIWLRPSTEPSALTTGAGEELDEAEPVEAEPADAVEAVVTPSAIVEAPVEAPVEAAPPPIETPAAPEPLGPVDVAAVASALRERLAGDLRLASFGDEWFLDDQLTRLSRGDTKRLRDYVIERGEPLADVELLNDVFGRRVNDRDFALVRFGFNQRMSKEKRDFEFVGTAQSRLWSTNGLPAIGTVKRKPAELGQDYRFLLEPTPNAAPPAPAGRELRHSLTFFEYEYGLLPLDARFAAFLPGPLLEDQRAAVLRFDVPQLYTSHLVEVRFPTANRGGFIGGLEQFYAENLVPGATITIERTDNDGQYTVKFGQTPAQERRLLQLDDRRGRFVFRPVTFFCEVNEDVLLSDTKFPGLNNTKPLDDKERRRPELVVRATFERIGDQVGEKGAPRYYALLDDLYAAVNVERPFTVDYLVSVLESDSHPEFERDPDGNAFFYEPLKAQ